MADQSADLIRYIDEHPLTAPFSPVAYYEPEEDALTFYFRSDPDYAKRIDDLLTVYLSLENDQLVGCRLKGIRRIVEDIGDFGVRLTDSRVPLRLVFLALLSSVPDGPTARKLFRELGRAATETNAEIELAMVPS